MFVFGNERKTGVPGEKRKKPLLSKGYTENKLNLHMAPGCNRTLRFNTLHGGYFLSKIHPSPGDETRVGYAPSFVSLSYRPFLFTFEGI